MSKEGVVRAQFIPPPTQGWNTRDPISDMNPLYAVEMENFYPSNGTVDMVKGYRYHSKTIGTGGLVKGLGVLKSTQYNKLVAIGDNFKIYDATTASAAATLVQLDNAATGNTNITPSALPYLQFFRDRLFITSGSSATTDDVVYVWTGTGNGASAAFTIGGNPAYGLGPMAVYRSRLYFLQMSTAATSVLQTSLYYGGVDAVTGALTEFPFKSYLIKGGLGIFIGTVSRAKDFNEDELFCIITDQGEILVYEGDSPSATTWRLIGHYYVSRPLGPRAFFYLGADLCIITAQGVVQMSAIMAGNSFGQLFDISHPISSAFFDAATTTLMDNFAWCGVNYPRGGFAVVNIPVTASTVSNQFYMNLESQAWCKRTNQNAFCWTIFNDELYFGGLSGRVFKADNGYFDEDPASESSVLPRNVLLRPAYNSLGDPLHDKRFISITPYVSMSEGLALTMGADVDFADTTPTTGKSDLSDTAYKLYTPLIGISGVGTFISPRIEQTVTTKRMSLNVMKIKYESGAI